MKGEPERPGITLLPGQTLQVHGAAIDPRRRAGLESTDRESQVLERLGELDGRSFAGPARWDHHVETNVDPAAEEGSGCKDSRPRLESPAVHGAHTADLASVD